MTTKQYWLEWLKAAGIRSLKTLAQTALAQTTIATIGTAAVISAVDWRTVVSASLLAAILSLLTSVAGIPEVPKTTTADVETVEGQEDDGTPDE